VIELTSDPEVNWVPNLCCSRVERRYLLLRRAGRKRDALMLGLGRALSNFESDAGDDPGLILLIEGLLRVEVYSRAKAAKVKAHLMKDAWRPEYFKPDR
jgi:hypothetical protein